jgi:hypothetical protein
MDLGHDQDGKISATPLELGESGGVSIYPARLLEWCKTVGRVQLLFIVTINALAWCWRGFGRWAASAPNRKAWAIKTTKRIQGRVYKHAKGLAPTPLLPI